MRTETAEAQNSAPWLSRRELRAVWNRGWRPWSPAQKRMWQCTGQRRAVVPPGLNGAFKLLGQQHCAATQHSQKGWVCSWGTWKAHVQAAKQLLHTEHQLVLFIKCMLTEKIGINFVHIKKIQFQFFLLHNLGTWASVITCWAENDGIVHTIVSLTPKRNEANGVKETKHIQESIKVIKAESLILLYTYISKKCYISKHTLSILDANKPALFIFMLW